MVNVIDYDILKTKEEAHENEYNEKYPSFASGPAGKDTYPVGSIFLSLRRRKVVQSEFAGKTFKKTFEEIVLSPDGRIGVYERVRSSRIV